MNHTEAAAMYQAQPWPRESPAALTVLIVDDDEAVREMCRDVVRSMQMQAREAATTEEALQMLEQYPVDVVITDLQVERLGGLELLQRVKQKYPQVATMVITQYGTIERAVQAMREGALDFLTKPFHIDELSQKLQRIVREQELDQENRVLREQLRSRPGFGGLIGTAPRMQRVYRMIEKVSQNNCPVLILGESGTGKELVARSIHFCGARRNRPFVPVECSALVPTLIESELFGYVKGAFTGALSSRQGLIEAANTGTLFLDEIGDLPSELQAKLLRVLQEKEVKPVGANERVAVSVRVIAATHRDLEAAVRNGSFRQDLYFRLNVVQIKLPPLRERRNDIPLLVTSFLEKFSDSGRPVRRVSEEALARLMAYDWPGNVRELENAIERAIALGSGPILQVADLPSNLQPGVPQGNFTETGALLPLEELERRSIIRALRETAGDKLAAARLLGIGKTTLYRKLKYYESQQRLGE